MNHRIVDISTPADLTIRHQQLIVDQSDQRTSIPVEDIAVLLLSSPGIHLSVGTLLACAEHRVAVVICDQKHQPAAISLPITGHSHHSRILRCQIAAEEPLKHKLWTDIVQAKILAQNRHLEKLKQGQAALVRLSKEVAPGDPKNTEATAARIYWKALFGDSFKRHADTPLNHALNYGYAVLRAAIARHIVCAGLHPALGIFHHNQYDSFALADDLIEPLRPLVDEIARTWTSQPRTTIDQDLKRSMLGLLLSPVSIDGEYLVLNDAIKTYVHDFKECLEGAKTFLRIPTF